MGTETAVVTQATARDCRALRVGPRPRPRLVPEHQVCRVEDPTGPARLREMAGANDRANDPAASSSDRCLLVSRPARTTEAKLGQFSPRLAMRTALVGVGAKDAAVSALGLQARAAAFTDVEIQAGCRRDFLDGLMLAKRTRDRRCQGSLKRNESPIDPLPTNASTRARMSSRMARTRSIG